MAKVKECRNNYCKHNKGNKCNLNEISINIFGECDNCDGDTTVIKDC